MRISPNRTSLIISTLTLVLSLSGASIALAWTGATTTPPAGNVAAPLNVGSQDQIKNGKLGVNSLAVFGDAAVTGVSTLNVASSSQFCLNSSCITAWPSVGSGFSGNGTINHIPVFIGPTSFGNSTLTDTGGVLSTTDNDLLVNTNSYINLWGTGLNLVLANTSNSGVAMTSTNAPVVVAGLRSNGSTIGDTTTSVNAGDNLLIINARAGDGTVHSPAAGADVARIIFGADQAPGAGFVPGRIYFQTANNTTGGLVETLRMVATSSRFSNEIVGTSLTYGQLRMVGGTYGAIFRNDGTNTYLLMTNQNDQYGGWGALRPFAVNDSTGAVTLSTTTVTSSVTAQQYCIGAECITPWPAYLPSPNNWNGIQVGNQDASHLTNMLVTGYLNVQGNAGIANTLDVYTRLGVNLAGGLSAVPAYNLEVGGSIKSDGGWLRTDGNYGWYNETWGGGLQMTDANWVRTYGTPSTGGLYTNGILNGASGLTVGYPSSNPPAGGAIINGNVGINVTDPGTYQLYVGGKGYFTSSVTALSFPTISDIRLKKDIAPLTGNLDKVLALQPVSYWWKDPSRGTGPQIGFIAQQVKAVVPQLVATDASTTLEAVDYARMSTLLVGSVQELNQKISDQQAQITSQQTQISSQQKEIDELKAELESLRQR